jgi:hypothetical protein
VCVCVCVCVVQSRLLLVVTEKEMLGKNIGNETSAAGATNSINRSDTRSDIEKPFDTVPDKVRVRPSRTQQCSL